MLNTREGTRLMLWDELDEFLDELTGEFSTESASSASRSVTRTRGEIEGEAFLKERKVVGWVSE